MKALRIYAGPAAREAMAREGLQPAQVRVVPAAAGGPKGLILGPLDRFLFGDWLPRSAQPVHLVGASIGAWRMATACLDDPAHALRRFEADYIAQHFEVPPGARRAPARQVSAQFSEGLRAFYGGRESQALAHPRYRLHVLASRGRHLLRREGRARTAAGYLGALVSNAVSRRSLGAWLERTVFSAGQAALPFASGDFRTRQLALTAQNFLPVLQASCAIPFVLEAVHDIPGAPPGAFWDGGITDYHLHLAWNNPDGLVLYPHFQQAVVPGWLDKPLRWRHAPTAALDRTVVLAPAPEWVRTLPHGKLPDRTDFDRYGNDHAGRAQAWRVACAEARRMADEFEAWLRRPDMGQVRAL